MLRKYPYPYVAMMTICSDLDETQNKEQYFEIARFLNTQEQTSAGVGVNLEIGNTIYFNMPEDQFSYWNTDNTGREMVHALVRSGHIDCFHSFGDLAIDRKDARRALEALSINDCRIECWVDHAAARTNFGPDIMRGQGDLLNSPAYHADITYQHGVRFVWCGRVTSIIGQDCQRSLRGIYSRKGPVESLRTIATESAKSMLARAGNQKYAMHASNEVIRPSTLRDGHSVYEFMRCNPYWGGVSRNATAAGVGEVLNDGLLDSLVDREGVCILYTHLGKGPGRGPVFDRNTVAAFHKLAEYSDEQKLLVTSTRRILGYLVARRLLKVESGKNEEGEVVSVDTSEIRHRGMPVDLDGITIYVDRVDSVRVFVDGVEATNVVRNPADEQGRQSISIPWQPLQFPSI